ncbi:MAG: SIS domain-containing protein [Phycisphaerales bacterium]|nr:SIS domain-containing protein [Phycisphaerales bacterium]
MPIFARNATECILSRLAQTQQALDHLRAMQGELVRVITTVREALESGKMLMTCGNGGSAAEALHLSEELIGRYRSSRAPLKSVCLCADTTALTCIANDFGFSEVFARQVEALASAGDQLIVLSTSGKSPNVLRALAAAKKCGAGTIGLLGGDGGEARALCDHAIVVASGDSAAIQEMHQVIVHILCESLEPA